MYLSKIDDLRNLTSLPAEWEFVVAGYWTPGDGGGGTFVWIDVPSGSYPADDSGIIIHNTTTLLQPGYFKRLYSGSINVRWFGAIMGSTDPNPTPHTITDVTQYVHAARDSNFAKNGTLYFPENKDGAGNIIPYAGAFIISSVQGEVNIIGDGQGSVLKAIGTNPVLTLGKKTPEDWRFSRVLNLQIDGANMSDGVKFDDADVLKPEYAGRWILESVFFINCKKAINKPRGNIGNSYINCTWYNNDFAYYAESHVPPPVPVPPLSDFMHSGADRFIGGHIRESAIVGIFLKCIPDFGQIIVDGTVIEGNPGFGVFIELSSLARLTGNAICFRNVWMEANCTAATVDIDGVTYNTIVDYYFKGVRSVRIDDCRVDRIKLIESSVNMFNCRADYSNLSYAFVEVDSQSSLVAYEHRSSYQTSENVFVNSLSYDGTGDIYGNTTVFTSVWGPLRTTLVAGLNNVVLWSDPTEIGEERWPGHAGGDATAYLVANCGTAVNTIWPSSPPSVNISCREMTLDMGQIVCSPTSGFLLPGEFYYFWSVHAKACPGILEPTALRGWIGGMPGAQKNLGQVIFKDQSWACSYDIKKIIADDFEEINLWFEGLSQGGIVRFCHWQVLAFARLDEAVAYANSKGIAYPGYICGAQPELRNTD